MHPKPAAHYNKLNTANAAHTQLTHFIQNHIHAQRMKSYM